MIKIRPRTLSHDASRSFHFYVDINPLFEHAWTGIPVVAAEFTQRFLTNLPDQTSLFFEDRLVSREAVEDALQRRSGLFLERAFHRGDADLGPLPLGRDDRDHIGFFPSVKRQRGVFDHEFSIVHDITTLLTPQFHAKINIDYHATSLRHDLWSNHLTFCISTATRDDVARYLGVPEDRLRIVGNGVAWPPEFSIRFDSEIGRLPVEPYSLVLGTREPRKNLQLLFHTLDENPDLLTAIRFVITGRGGWLEDNVDVPASVKDAITNGRILVTGFVSEYTKYKLLRAAQFLVFPSLLEGFGLPVAEAISVGTPCLASLSSSMPEVGGTSCRYFDPLSPTSLAMGIRAMIRDSDGLRQQLHAERDVHRERLSWDNIFTTVVKTMTGAVRTEAHSMRGTER